jgi:signal transduction histidine kinase
VILCTSNIKGNENPLPEQHKIIVFRIIQECLQNILKHSGADEICTDFDFANGSLQISIRDNGIGFEVQKASLVGLGINNITHRASLIGGKAEIESTVGEGTTITLTIPYV